MKKLWRAFLWWRLNRLWDRYQEIHRYLYPEERARMEERLHRILQEVESL